MGKEIICYCKNVSRERILDAIKSGAKSLSDIQKKTGACTGNRCKELNPKGICCRDVIIGILMENTKYEKETRKCCCNGKCC